MGAKVPGVDDTVMGLSISGGGLWDKADGRAGRRPWYPDNMRLTGKKAEKPAPEAFFSDFPD
jgi:hypothetical protein